MYVFLSKNKDREKKKFILTLHEYDNMPTHLCKCLTDLIVRL